MRGIIQSSALRLSVLVWFACWLVVVMPGHTRGIVKLPGSDLSSKQGVSCCEPAPPSCCQAGPKDASASAMCALGEHGKQPNPIDPAKHCAICFLKAQLRNPPPLVLYTPYLGELDELEVVVDESITHDQAAPSQMRGRAPPA